MTVPTLNAAPLAAPVGSSKPLAKKFPSAQGSAIDVMIHAGQGGNYLDNDLSTFRTTQMTNLLLVDDEPKLIFKQVSHVFGPRGSQIELVRSGSEAIRHIAKGQTDVVLLDVSLPDMSGLEVYQR